MSVALRPLLENRLPIQGKFTKDIRLGEQEGRFLTVELSGRQALFVLSDILADIIVEHLQIRYLMAELAREYGYLSERERSEILVCTVRKLWYGGGKERLEQKKKGYFRARARLPSGRRRHAGAGWCAAVSHERLRCKMETNASQEMRPSGCAFKREKAVYRTPALWWRCMSRSGDSLCAGTTRGRSVYPSAIEQGNRIQVTAEDCSGCDKGGPAVIWTIGSFPGSHRSGECLRWRIKRAVGGYFYRTRAEIRERGVFLRRG